MHLLNKNRFFDPEFYEAVNPKDGLLNLSKTDVNVFVLKIINFRIKIR